MITVGHKWDRGAIDVTRKGSPLGNPFVLLDAKDDITRNEVCDLYEQWFLEQLRTNKLFLKELKRLYKLAQTQDIVLGCFCAPRRCHADTIKAFLDKSLGS